MERIKTLYNQTLDVHLKHILSFYIYIPVNEKSNVNYNALQQNLKLNHRYSFKETNILSESEQNNSLLLKQHFKSSDNTIEN